MFTNFSAEFSQNVTILIASFALLWFLAGLAVGTRIMGRRPARSGQRPKKRQQNRGGTRVEIYVGNLSYDVSERDLQKAFARYGRVLSSRIIKHRGSGKSKGFGFVEMGDQSAVNSAIEGLDGTNLKGRRIVANEARSGNDKRH